jgi:hypothetical protein
MQPLLRERTLGEVARLGFEINRSLPLLDDDSRNRRSEREVADRVLCLHCVVAIAHGAPAAAVERWAEEQGLAGNFTPLERALIAQPSAETTLTFRGREEAVWALLWASGLVDQLDFSGRCDNRLIALVPNIPRSESAQVFRDRIRVRPGGEIFAALDLAYCLHWAVVEAQMRGRPAADAYVFVERRRALEWLTSTDGWDDVCMDT